MLKHSVIFSSIASELHPTIVKAMSRALHVMEDGTPCPAPQVSAGAHAVASLAMTMIARIIAGEKVTKAPELVLIDMYGKTSMAGIQI